MGREIDGQALYRDLDQSLRRQQPARLPADPAVAAGDVAKVTEAAERFLVWYDAVSGANLPDSSAWSPGQFEYQLSVGARMADGELVLASSQFDSGKLDWHDFDVVSGATLDAIADAAPSGPDTATYLPTPVRFHGASGAGHWTFEDASVEIGAVQAGPEDLATMVAVDFAVRYSNDFFMIPLPLSVGSVTRVDFAYGDRHVRSGDRRSPGQPTRRAPQAVRAHGPGSDARDSALLLFPALADLWTRLHSRPSRFSETRSAISAGRLSRPSWATPVSRSTGAPNSRGNSRYPCLQVSLTTARPTR